jgi:hypothetical protein
MIFLQTVIISLNINQMNVLTMNSCAFLAVRTELLNII